MFVSENSRSLRQALCVIQVYCEGFILSFVRSWMESVLPRMLHQHVAFGHRNPHLSCAFNKTDLLSNTLLTVVSGGRTYQAGDGQYDQT